MKHLVQNLVQEVSRERRMQSITGKIYKTGSSSQLGVKQ